jgi:hypothetical protein
MKHRRFKILVKILKLLIFSLIAMEGVTTAPAHARTSSAEPEVEWYPPESEKGRTSDRSRVVISGRTQPDAKVQVDGDSVTVIAKEKNATSEGGPDMRTLRSDCKVYEYSNSNSKVLGTAKKGNTARVLEGAGSWFKVALSPKGVGFISQPCFMPKESGGGAASNKHIESRDARANFDGFFEVVLDLPQGLAQIPVSVTSPGRGEKTFLISVDVTINKNTGDNIKINQKVSENKPPAAAKKIRLWGGLGFTYQSDSQTTTGSPDLNFKTVQAPGIVARGGYWGDRWGIDFYFRDAPGKIEAEAPFTVKTDSYHWRTMEAKGLYQFDRGPNSRIAGQPSQWQLRFGSQLQQIPFFDISNTNAVSIREHSLTTATLGVGLLLGQERDWSWEFALGLQYPMSASGQGNAFKVSSASGYEAQIGAAYKFAPNWRMGVFSYTQSLAYQYQFLNDAGTLKEGRQNLFYTTFDLRLGYEF